MPRPLAVSPPEVRTQHPQGSPLKADPRPVWWAVLVLSTTAMAADLTLLFIAVRSAMGIGTCATGGSYMTVHRCNDGVGAMIAIGLPSLFLIGILMWLAAAKLCAPQIVLITWPVLFISLAYDFVESGVGDRDATLIVCGALMLLMGATPLWLAVRIVRQWRRRRPAAGQPDTRAADLRARLARISWEQAQTEDTPRPKEYRSSLLGPAAKVAPWDQVSTAPPESDSRRPFSDPISTSQGQPHSRRVRGWYGLYTLLVIFGTWVGLALSGSLTA